MTAKLCLFLSMSAVLALLLMLCLSFDAVAILVSMAYVDTMTLLPVHVSASMWLTVAICLPVIVRAAERMFESSWTFLVAFVIRSFSSFILVATMSVKYSSFASVRVLTFRTCGGGSFFAVSNSKA